MWRGQGVMILFLLGQQCSVPRLTSHRQRFKNCLFWPSKSLDNASRHHTAAVSLLGKVRQGSDDQKVWATSNCRVQASSLFSFSSGRTPGRAPSRTVATHMVRTCPHNFSTLRVTKWTPVAAERYGGPFSPYLIIVGPS